MAGFIAPAVSEDFATNIDLSSCIKDNLISYQKQGQSEKSLHPQLTVSVCVHKL